MVVREFSLCLPWKRLDLWVSHILHDWCNPDAIGYQLLLVSLILEPCHTDISAGLDLTNAEVRVCGMSLGFCGKYAGTTQWFCLCLQEKYQEF